MAFYTNNPSPLGRILGGIHEMAKNPKKKFPRYCHGESRSAKEHIQEFKDSYVRAQIAHHNVACMLFPYSLGDMAYNWYLKLLARFITSWTNLKDCFINQFQVYIDPTILYHQFSTIRKEIHELLALFNT
jgi:hypothetical protein